MRSAFLVAAAATLVACTGETGARSGDAGRGGARSSSGGSTASGGAQSGGAVGTTGGTTSARGGNASGGAGAGGARDAGNGGAAPRDAANPDGGSEPAVPIVPVGPDAYRDLGRLPVVRLGTRTYLRSTYDRAGGNDWADASHFLRMDATDRAVALDVAGQGYLYFARANHWHGSPWHYVVDGTDDVVQETSTADPTMPVAGSTYLPADAFPAPLAVTWSVTQGADLSWVPIPFQRSLSIAYERTHYGTGYFIYQLFPDGAENASRPPSSFALKAPDPIIAKLFASAGQDMSPPDADVQSAAIDVLKGAAVELFSVRGARTVRALTLHAPKSHATALAGVRLRITWDGRPAPSVDAPVPLFFGAGTLYDRNDTEWLVKALLFTIHEGANAVDLSTYFPMPFFTGARVELVGGAEDVTGITAELRTVPNTDDPRTTGYFHATYVDHGTPTAGKDLVVLDTKSVEDGGDVCGTFNGMSFIFSDQAVLSTLEGDPRFFFDDSGTPQAQGTGTEEWAGGGDYWGGQTMSLPLAGHPVGAPDASSLKSPEDAIESAYRLLVADAMPFGKNARIQLEHGGADDSTEHYQSVAYWYGVPGACLSLTDSLHVGDADDEKAHAYLSPTASDTESITSRYEVGVDHVGATEVVPESTDTGRHMTGTTEFRVRLDPRNVGAMLRRKLDYSYPDQRADVFVADDRDGAPFVAAGTWYLAGSNTCVFSFPPKETDPAMPVLQTSNRRFRDDEFLVPRRLTEGRSAVRVRVVFRPVGKPFLPGAVPATPAWSELRYSAYSWILAGTR